MLMLVLGLLVLLVDVGVDGVCLLVKLIVGLCFVLLVLLLFSVVCVVYVPGVWLKFFSVSGCLTSSAQ
jgi:hypothetical protein